MPQPAEAGESKPEGGEEAATESPARPQRRRHSRRRKNAEEGEAEAKGEEDAPSKEEKPEDKQDEGIETPAECTPDDVNVASDLVDISYLLRQSNETLRQFAEANGVRRIPELRRTDLIYEIMRSEYAKHGFRFGKGVLDIPRGGSYGFLRRSERNYLICDDDVYVSPTQIRRFDLQKGDTIYGVFRRPRMIEKSGAVIKVSAVNYDPPVNKEHITAFDDLIPQFSADRYVMEYRPEVISTRILDLISPIGKGQRGLIVAPPRAGKTLLLRDIANAISFNYPSVELIMLLIDERPEEVTDMQRTVKGEVVSSTFDESGDRHIQVAEMVLEKAKRLVEHGKDVFILLDSLTRLARVYNYGHNLSGKILSGGMDASALQKPKRFFGAARSIEGGGSLTIIATALIETGSRMDDLIYEEFKGTGNMEVVLDRRISEKRVFPAIDIDRSGTRKEELLFTPDDLQKVWNLRKKLSEMTPLAKMECLIKQVKLTGTNAELLRILK
ncbi:transcription termination factor Rho [bacterium]|nr:transcription termination factor Rho [bacterium]